VNYFNRFGRVWQVYVQAEGEFRTKAENVGQFYVRNLTGQPVPLATLVTMKEVNGPEFTIRFNEFRSAQINGTLAPGFSTQQGMKALEEVFAQSMPRDMGYDYMGMSFQEKVASQGVPPEAVFGFSVLVVFLLLAAQYESWTLPFGVLLGTPIAMFGAVGALYLLRFPDGRVLPDRPRHGDRAGREERHPHRRVLQGGLREGQIALRRCPVRRAGQAASYPHDRLRLHPGVLPLVIATGAGANSRRILGSTVMGGMLTATLIAIFIIPVTFYVAERFAPKPKPAVPPDRRGPGADTRGGR
jgi:HAE1 family hydrophobic/amphiphilic exporter-1